MATLEVEIFVPNKQPKKCKIRLKTQSSVEIDQFVFVENQRVILHVEYKKLEQFISNI